LYGAVFRHEKTVPYTQTRWADADELKRLRELGRLFRAGATGARLDQLKKPKPRPTL
jgi:hypothetical protein